MRVIGKSSDSRYHDFSSSIRETDIRDAFISKISVDDLFITDNLLIYHNNKKYKRLFSKIPNLKKISWVDLSSKTIGMRQSDQEELEIEFRKEISRLKRNKNINSILGNETHI